MSPASSRDPEPVRLARPAMATRFEIVLYGDNPAQLRRAGNEALAEIDEVEAQLSLFRPASEISHVNARGAAEPVRVSPPVFRLLKRAQKLSEETGGAFDITIAPLMRCWGFMNGSGVWPDPAEVARVRRQVGMNHVILDESNWTVRLDTEGVMLDLGAIGKGYAIDRAAETLREAGVHSALLHGGTSTVFAIGRPPDQETWTVAVESPKMAGAPQWLAQVPLRDEALSVSAVWGKCFEHEGRVLGHVLDPRTAQPVAGALLAAVALPSATETDALSTALLVEGPGGHEKVAQLRPAMRTLVVGSRADDFRLKSEGISLKSAGKH